ncbi:MAG: 16S rRNA (guanine(966)-N(2))-methyltransferase RsmD [Deltaproteobacteria bacterium]|nr:16S rRNA (guanine(966)-N(2))-methyltransferase RsmD [Deltaproteobacteria bacterium]
MRVIGGKFKGRNLASFKGMSIRPTSDKVREAIFNILPREFPFKRVLDIFAGTGAMGIEALSRGAEDVIFVDSSPSSISVIKKNLEACGVGTQKVFKKDAVSAVRFFSQKQERFDLVFIDPPYDSSLVEETMNAIDNSGILSPEGVLVAETSKRIAVKLEYSNLELTDERKYGDTVVYFFSLKEKQDA